jgi:hypothetical protein
MGAMSVISKPTISGSGTATARFIGNEWEKQPKGEAYIEKLGGPTSDIVKQIGRAHV